MLLAFKPVVLDLPNHRVAPATLPDYIWDLAQVQRFSCHMGHTKVQEACGCGIRTTLNLDAVRDLWQAARSIEQPIALVTVQVLGGAILDPVSLSLRSKKIYFHGTVQPQYLSYSDWGVWWYELRLKYLEKNWLTAPQPRLYSSLEKAIEDVAASYRSMLEVR